MIKPILISHYCDNGILKSERWMRDDKCHNTTGPAIIRYYSNGLIYNICWYLNGEQCDIHHWCRKTGNDPLLMKMMYS